MTKTDPDPLGTDPLGTQRSDVRSAAQELAETIREIEDRGVSGAVADAARALAEEPTLQQTLDRVVELAMTMVPGCEAAGISLVSRGRIRSVSVSEPFVARGDALQYELGEGPCLDAIRLATVVESPDVAADVRWPRWAPTAVRELGVGSMLGVQLYTSADAHGALNLYARATGAFSEESVHLATTFAAVAAAAISAARTEEQLQSAVRTRTLIGQAQGMIMERYALSEARAFAVMSRVSQDSNVKLVDVAREIVSTRRMPGVDGPAGSAQD
ncbi:GAF and ANTAR domain-containing protein [Cellulosimicrobium sp. NPDC057127]|uniref:GAF and ANTAR domain-containing protein n=1 Tax=Cellulosimicrobium sp. NPDC057127 TaxID=3346026 RepID=UPI00362DE65A